MVAIACPQALAMAAACASCCARAYLWHSKARFRASPTPISPFKNSKQAFNFEIKNSSLQTFMHSAYAILMTSVFSMLLLYTSLDAGASPMVHFGTYGSIKDYYFVHCVYIIYYRVRSL